MRGLDIIIPVKDEAGNIKEITRRLDFSLKRAGIKYCMIFVDDNSTDSTVKEITYASRMYPIRLIHKRGKPGKAYSILEGIKASSKQIIAMIDGDLQYSPEYLPEMFHLMKEHGVVVANRKMNGSSSLRKIGSKVNSLIFGKILFGFGFDTQSGLKMFRRDIFRHIKESDVTAWTIDMPLLHTAVELGYSIGCVDIEFLERKNGYSKIHYAKAAYEIAKGSVKLKLKRKRVYPIKSSRGPALGAGVIYKGKRYVTHTHLPHHQSALLTLKLWQKVALVLGLSTFILGLLINAKITVIVFIAILTFIYFADLIFSTYVLLKSLHFPPEIKVTDEEIAKLKEKNLPIYTILCPLYKEARVVPEFIEFISKIDWPKDKLDIILLLEEDDEETRKAVDWLGYFSYIRTLIVPASQPKTKPKACNFGLAHARGEYVVVYDAEDHPDPLQLKKAYIAFGRTSSKVVCLQSKLNYYNTDTNLLTKLFTAEYSLWFDIILPGFQSIETSVPLGGTSNHFRTKDLKGLHGWDAFNVTEDCDLGVRLFKAGYKTAIIDSTTLEEANSNIKNWLRQRSRWIKGYLQTYFVHMRSPISFVKEHGIHAFIFQLVIGMRMSFIVINPILWLTTISYFALYRFVGPAIESVYPAPVFYMAVTCLIVGNFMYLYNYMIACAKKEQWSVIKFVFLVPFYWLMTSFAAGIAFYQLIAKPHYWEKTHHGLHLKVQEKPIKAKRLTLAGVGLSFIQIKFSSLSAKMAIFQENLTLLVSKLFHIKHTIFTNLSPIYQKILYKARILVRHKFAGAGILVISSFFENFFNFLYNAYLGRALRVEDFGLISLFGSFLFIVKIPSSAIARTVTYETAYYFGKYKNAVKDFWVYVRRRSVLYSSILSLLWLVSIPFLKNFFHSDSTLPFILFTPVWFIGIVSSVDLGFVSGNLMFIVLAVLAVTYSLGKLLFSYIFVTIGQTNLVYAATPAAMFISFLIGWYYANSVKRKKINIPQKEIRKFPIKFLFSSTIIKFSEIAFFTLDVILAKHFLSPIEAGEYALISLVGKMIFFIGGLFGQFILPLVSKEEGAKGKSKIIFYKLLFVSTAFSFMAYLFVGVFGKYTGPILFGQKIIPVVYLMPLFGLAMLGFQIADNIVSFEQARNKHFFAVVSLLIAFAQLIGIAKFHTNLDQFVWVMTAIGLGNLTIMLFFHFTYDYLRDFFKPVSNNLLDFISLFTTHVNGSQIKNKKILIYNWRDIKHDWAGGAEVYLHELAKRWVKMGYSVTIFCGNDGHDLRHEIIDGVKVIRRGGFYMVYFWAFLYYIFLFRGKYDIIIDSENGIPFFTPIYTRKKVFLLIHHVHQEVFQVNLKPPLSWIGAFLEKRLMPLVYRNTEVITVSPSSKADILDYHLTQKDPHVIYNGVDLKKYTPGAKSLKPMVLYLGRIRTHKSLHIFVYTAKKVLESLPEVKFVIAGEGQESGMIKDLIHKLNLEKNIKYMGKVSEDKKISLYQSAWLFVNPSLMEGWGITTIEANACGTPVIASNVAGLRDSVYNPHSGILVPYGDVDEFAKNIKALIEDKDLRDAMSKEAIIWAKKFDWNKSAKAFSRIMNSSNNQKLS